MILKILLTNIVVLLLFTQSITGRNTDTSISTCLEENKALHTEHYTIFNKLGIINLGVAYGGNPPNFNQGIAKLEWSFDGILVNTYVISKRIESAEWIVIANVTNYMYSDTIEDGLCNVYIDYKIETTDGTGDLIISNIEGKVFTETRLPEKPIFDSVSIVNNSKVILGWDASTSADVMGTVIYRWEQNWVTIDTVFGDSNTFTYDDSYSPCNENFLYAIAAMDSCGNTCPKTEQTAQRPIFLYNIEFDLCSKTNTLTWEHYINAIIPFIKYEIWSSINGSTFSLIDTVLSDINYYNHTYVDNSTDYSYFVRAVFSDLDFTSTSCTKSITTGSFIIPDMLYLANATVLTNNHIELTIDIDLNPGICTWEILRSEAGGESQSLLTSFYRSDVNSSPYHHIDSTADGSTGYYNYSVNVYDSCGALSLATSTMKTIFLTGEQLSLTENKLTWNTFKGFDGGVDSYCIFRMLGDVIPTTPIDTVGVSDTTYIDNISSVAADESKFLYWIQAIEGDTNTYGFQENSNSNIISFFKETDFYFPNAFRPDSDISANNIFKPVTIGFGGSNYLLQIYNRWGQLIFESTDPLVGWDGTYKGNQSPQGTYVYKLVYTSVFDVTKQHKGTIMLID